MGVCYAACDLCTGPNASDCVKCVDGARWNAAGECECSEFWDGAACTNYVQPCDDRCNGCSGPSNYNCTACVEHADHRYDGACVCYSEWDSTGCATWSGICHTRCSHCEGPRLEDCLTCIDNSFGGDDGFGNSSPCVCNDDWDGPNCREYTGICHDRCNGCHSPTDIGCYDCVKNAQRDSNGSCVCNAGWSGLGCIDYIGACHSRCENVSGGVDCSGPSSFECDRCVTHAHRDYFGECVCDKDWDGPTCSEYVGKCWYTCVGCTGPLASDCV
jgi:proprotein convertase subtilisin/kexin type 5